MARPKLPEGAERDENLIARLKSDEKEKFIAVCHLEGIGQSTSVRQFILGKIEEWEVKNPKKLKEALKLLKKIETQKPKAK
ncbi:MAG: hypothetical protein HY231_24085 [Acidobacteria bacterium]|nr:hypothetical protein [Acidobacteriota bacterium]